jgi:hypothetical protein
MRPSSIKDWLRITPLVMCIVITGCSTQFVKTGVSQQEINRDHHYCKAFADGQVSMPKPSSSTGPSSSTTYHSGNIYGSRGATSYSGTSTTRYDTAGDGGAHFGSSIIALIGHRYEYNDCMKKLGYVEETNP